MRIISSLLLLLSFSLSYAAEQIWLDVRSPQEFSEGHVDGAVNIPFDQITNRMSEVTDDKNSEILLYCRSGRRAEFAMSALQELGYRNVTNLRTLEAAENYSKEHLETAE